MKRTITSLVVFLVAALLPFFAFAEPFAHGNLFNPTAISGGTDLSIGYLGDIYGVVDGVLHGSGSQIMGQMFMVFNSGALILGGIIVIYTTLISMMNTANEGEMLGKKWNSIWIPLRTVLGIALLIPKATGYCAIQIFMMWVIVQGVGLADVVWNHATDYLAAGGVVVQPPLGTEKNVSESAQDMFLQTVCLAGLQTLFNQAYQDAVKAGDNPPAIPNFMASINPLVNTGTKGPSKFSADLPNFKSSENIGAQWTNLNGACGTVSFTKSTAKGNADLRKAYEKSIQVGVQQMLLDLSGPSQTIVSNLIYPPTDVEANPKVKDYVSGQLLINATQDYEGIVYPAQRAISNKLKDGNMNDWILSARKQGWINAGAYYATMVSNNEYTSGATFTPPKGTTDMATAMKKIKKDNVNGTLVPYVFPKVNKLKTQITTSSSVLNSFIESKYLKKGKRTGDASKTHFGAEALGISGFILALLRLILTPVVNVILALAGLASAQSTGANPVVLISMMGYGLVGMVAEVWTIGAITLGGVTLAASAVPFVALGVAVSTVVEWIVPLIWTVTGAMFVEGVVMAYYVPLIPFILFLFGAVGWLVATLEAMVAAPLVALGITHPEGQEIMGKADPAVLLLVNVFLRPSMMIIGFIAGIILSYVSLWMLNAGFGRALLGGLGIHLGTGTSGIIPGIVGMLSHGAIGFIFAFPAFLAIYVGLVIALMNYSFSLINVIPDKVMRWISGGTVEGVAGEAGKMLGEAKGGLESGAKAGAEGMKDVAGKLGQKSDQMKADAKISAPDETIQSSGGDSSKT